MNLPVYNKEGKKLTWEQHLKRKKELEEQEQKLREQNNGEKPGRCPKCDTTKFFLRVISGGVIVRTCKNCQNEVRL